MSRVVSLTAMSKAIINNTPDNVLIYLGPLLITNISLYSPSRSIFWTMLREFFIQDIARVISSLDKTSSSIMSKPSTVRVSCYKYWIYVKFVKKDTLYIYHLAFHIGFQIFSRDIVR